jgi:hypothetical protein
MPDIRAAEQLVTVDFKAIELAEVRLSKGDPTEYVAGRIVDRFDRSLTLRYRGHEHEVADVTDWTLERYQPVRSPVEASMIREGWA